MELKKNCFFVCSVRNLKEAMLDRTIFRKCYTFCSLKIARSSNKKANMVSIIAESIEPCLTVCLSVLTDFSIAYFSNSNRTKYRTYSVNFCKTG